MGFGLEFESCSSRAQGATTIFSKKWHAALIAARAHTINRRFLTAKISIILVDISGSKRVNDNMLLVRTATALKLTSLMIFVAISGSQKHTMVLLSLLRAHTNNTYAILKRAKLIHKRWFLGPKLSLFWSLYLNPKRRKGRYIIIPWLLHVCFCNSVRLPATATACLLYTSDAADE